ncbi:MAG TPA: hypothetical protein PKC13_18985 [Blastocatellia bacterium]|nr:hypothetical protein [Blastocatellia bacterium]HMY70872.1 hypothetical protein [Blastocatellia bacterium]
MLRALVRFGADDVQVENVPDARLIESTGAVIIVALASAAAIYDQALMLMTTISLKELQPWQMNQLQDETHTRTSLPRSAI